jgi:23S rRNA (cytosine1962-C5)-methyltransferase
MIKTLCPTNFPDYELIDAGSFQKIERFGNQVLIRPEPQAVWLPELSRKEWHSMADTIFEPDRDENERGRWILGKNSRESWQIRYPIEGKNLVFNLQLTSFKHLGIFPEQAGNWDFIYTSCQKRSSPKVLNMFAYTGGASLAARAAGAEVWHLDSVKKVLNWTKQNMESSGLQDIRWVLEDAFSFAQREKRREKKYDGIILDPPAYGRGPDGERWIMESMIDELMEACASILNPGGFLVLNLYSMGLSALIAENLVKKHFKISPEIGELFVPDRAGIKLPLGIFARFDSFKE